MKCTRDMSPERSIRSLKTMVALICRLGPVLGKVVTELDKRDDEALKQ